MSVEAVQNLMLETEEAMEIERVRCSFLMVAFVVEEAQELTWIGRMNRKSVS